MAGRIGIALLAACLYLSCTTTAAAAANLTVAGNGTVIEAGDSSPSLADHTDFGQTGEGGGAVTRTFTITSTGTTNLELYPDRPIRGTNDTFQLTKAPTLSVAPGKTTTFQITFRPATAALYETTLFIYGNYTGGNKGDYCFTVQGRGGTPDINVAGSRGFGAVPVYGVKGTNSFSVQNAGTGYLRLTGSPRVTIAGTHATDFAVGTQPASTIVAGTPSPLTIVFDPSATGLRTATAAIASDDADENPYTLTLTGTGVVSDIEVRGNLLAILNGDKTPRTADGTDFGGARVDGGTVTFDFSIYNLGGAFLHLTNGTKHVYLSGGASADFTVAADAPTFIDPYGSATFSLRFNPAAVGLRSTTVTIPTDDPDENPYTFAVQGTGLMPEIMVQGNGLTVADGDTTPGLTDHTDFGTAHTRGARVTRTFTVRNTGTSVLNLTGAPRVALSGSAAFSLSAAPAASVATNGSTTFQIRFAPTAAGVFSNTLSIANDDLNENPYTFAVRGTAIAPECQVSGNGSWIVDGDTQPSTPDHTAFGCLPTTAAGSHTFTLRNVGTTPLYLSGSPPVSVSGPAAADFTVTQPTATNLAAGASTTLQVTCAPRAGGLRAATLSIRSNDEPHDPYTFAVEGLGARRLTNNVFVTASTMTNYFQCDLTTADWGVVAVRPRARDFDLAVYTSTNLLAYLGVAETEGLDTEFVALNGSRLGALKPCAMVYGYATTNYDVEAEWSIPDLVVGTVYTNALAANEPVDLHEIGLTGGTVYHVRVTPANPSADLALYLFDPAQSTGARDHYAAMTNAGGGGVSERMIHLTANTGYYAILVENRNGLATSYTLSVSTGPRLRVSASGQPLANSDATPSTADKTDFGAACVYEASPATVFTIENQGVADLRLTAVPAVTFGGEDAASFGVSKDPTNRIAPGASTTFQAVFRPNHSGLCTATVTIANNEAGQNPFRFAVRGRGFYRLADADPRPFAAVPEDVSFQTAPQSWTCVAVKGAPADRTLVAGTAADWSGSLRTSAVAGARSEFLVLPPMASTTYYARVSGGAAGSYQAELARPAFNLSLGSTEFVSMTANDAVRAYLVTLTAGQPYYFATDPMLGAAAAEDVSLFVVRPGRAWTSRSNCDWNADTAGRNVREALALTAPETGTYLVLVVNESWQANTYWHLVAAAAVPDMRVTGNGQPISDGATTSGPDNHTAFDSTSTGSASTRTFTIWNDGYADLTLDGSPRVQLTGPHAADFTVTQLPAATVPLRGSNTTFVVTFRPTARGSRTATLAIPNSQAGRTPYDFAVRGAGLAPVAAVVGNGYDIASGDSTPYVSDGTDFFKLTLGPWARTNRFTVSNNGDHMLYLTNAPLVTFAGPHAADFRAFARGTTIVGPGAATDLYVIFQPRALGLRQATLRMACNDPARNPYIFAVQGTAERPRLVRCRPAGDDGLELCWTSTAGALYEVWGSSTLPTTYTERLASGVQATAPSNTVWVSLPGGQRFLYIRVRVADQY